MKILGIEASGQAASVAVVEDDILKGEFTLNNRMTHSETLLPMLSQLLDMLGLSLDSVDAIASSSGPGSFTGLRIGAATVKGLALAKNIPVIKVSSLASLAYNVWNASEEVICPIMDARREQVYAAAYYHGITLIEESALDIHDFIKMLNEAETEAASFVFLGDGVPVYDTIIAEELDGEVSFVSAENNRQRAASAAVIGQLLYSRWLRKNGFTAGQVKETGADGIPKEHYDDIVMRSDELVPEYIRRPQAERERLSGKLGDAGAKSLEKIGRG